MPRSDINDPADIMTGSHAAKRLGVSLTTLRRLVREGILWTVPMNGGGVGLSESEVQRFIDRLDEPAQKGK